MIRCAALLLAFAVVPARADAPLPPPVDQVVRSPNGRCAARADAAGARVLVTGRTPDGRAVAWSVPGWHRDLLVSDDCRRLGLGYEGLNLLDPGDRDAATPVMTFHGDGVQTRVVRLGELYPDLSVLPRTVSHWSWHRGTAWDGRRWTVHTVDGRVLAFAP